MKPQCDLKLHCDPTNQRSLEAGTKDSGHSILLTTIVTILFLAVSFLTILLEDIYDTGIFENVYFLGVPYIKAKVILTASIHQPFLEHSLLY